MTELEHIEIEGFKGLEHVEFEPTDINLITGRNNTGKTSFLEAIDLSRKPEKIQQFGQNASAVVNHDFSEAVIETKTISGTDELIVRSASAEESERHFREALTEHLKSSFNTGETEIRENKGSLPNLKSYSTRDADPNERFQKTISKTVTRAVAEVPDSLSGVHLVIELKNEKYPYLHFKKGDWRLMAEISGILESVLLDEFGEENVEEHPDSYVVRDPENNSKIIEFETGFSSILDGGLFLREPPSSRDVTSIVAERLIETTEDADGGDDAVRVDDIGDFLKRKGIVDQLKTFSLDTLIFETEDGEKQPLPYEFMGDGFKSMVGLLWELMDDEIEDQIVLLEEPETHMHPGYIREVVYFLINLAGEEDVQLFITTHDSDFINDFFTENLTDEEESYLEDEFSLLRMEENSAVVEDYETARENLKDLHLDLRGI